MTCGCSNNNRNNISNPKKLYQGVGQDMGQNTDQNIVSLACGGNPITDIYRPLSQQGGLIVYRGSAAACKFTPTSRCLDSIIFYGSRSYTPAHNLHFEIRENDSATNMPKGAPGTSTGRIKDVTDSFPTSFFDYPVTFSAELPAANVPYWIVIYSDDYYCDAAYMVGNERFEMSQTFNISGSNRAYYSPSAQCSWYLSGSNDSWAIETFKTTYTAPSSAQVYNVCWGPGLGSTCLVPPERPVIATGTVFTIKADMANNGATGKIRAVFNANGVDISDQNTPSLATFTGTQFWSPTVSYTMPSTDVTLTMYGYGWDGSVWVLTDTKVSTISKSAPTCTGISIDASTLSANVGDIITLTAYGITPTTQPFTVTFTDATNTVLGICTSSNGMCSINWNTTGKVAGYYVVKAAVTGQCTSTTLTIGLSPPRRQWNVDITVRDSVTTNFIQGANVTIGVRTLQTDANGHVLFTGVDEGSIDINIVKTGYNNITDPQYLYNNITLTYQMVPISQNPGSLRFVTSPPGIQGAEVHFVGDIPTLKGSTDAGGIFSIGGLTAGRVVNYQVVKTGYNTATGSATVVGNTTTDVLVTMTPTSTTGSACIHSNPSGASVKIDNITQSGKTTALSGGGCTADNIIGGLTAGSHNYELSLLGYQNKTGTFDVTIGQTLDYDAGVLTPLSNLGTLSISSSPDGARIYIMMGGIYQDTHYVTGTSSNPAIITTLTAGTYSYKLILSGYDDYVNTFVITTGQTTTVNVTLTPSTPTTGILSISSQPEGAHIYIMPTGGSWQDTSHVTGPQGYPTLITGLVPGNYSYKLTYPIYEDNIGQFTITSGQTTGPVHVNLISIPIQEGGGGAVIAIVGVAVLGAMMLSSGPIKR